MEMEGGHKMSNELHIRPSYSFNRNKFITVKRCNGCGIIADEYYYMGDVCPNCGHDGTTELVAKWVDGDVNASRFVWYNPLTWGTTLEIPNGKWITKETEDEI